MEHFPHPFEQLGALSNFSPLFALGGVTYSDSYIILALEERKGDGSTLRLILLHPTRPALLTYPGSADLSSVLSIVERELSSILSSLPCPTLFLVGEEWDKEETYAMLSRILSTLPDARATMEEYVKAGCESIRRILALSERSVEYLPSLSPEEAIEYISVARKNSVTEYRTIGMGYGRACHSSGDKTVLDEADMERMVEVFFPV